MGEPDPLSSKRRIIPRWREYGATLLTGELSRSGSRSDVIKIDRSFIDKKISDWVKKGGVAAAWDLVECAYVLGQYNVAQEAAQFLLKNKNSLSKNKTNVAKQILGENGEQVTESISTTNDIRDRYINKIRELKSLISMYPRDAFLRVDLSRCYAILGQADEAKSSMRIALQLSPFSRFVLRSAARLYIHLDAPDLALQMLSLNSRTIHDPWLLSVSLSCSLIAEMPIKEVRSARKLLTVGKFSAFHLTELNGSLGTISFFSGDTKPARKYFKESMKHPTENTFAQAQWANRYDSGIFLPGNSETLPFSFESRTRRAALDSDWNSVIFNCREWLLDEPYSSIPAATGSFYASAVLQEHKLAEEFAVQGLISNPDDPILKNNYAVSLAYKGDISAAKQVFSTIDRGKHEHAEPTFLATEGLIAFREGNLELGRKKYEESIAVSDRRGHIRSKMLAMLHLAREEKNHSVSNVIALLKKVSGGMKDFKGTPEYKMLCDLEKEMKKS